jgi:hypothetical protein
MSARRRHRSWLPWAIAIGAVVLWLVAGPGSARDVALGTAGPLAAAIGTWILVARTQARAPEQVSGVLIKLFGAKLVLFGVYILMVVLLFEAGTVTFVVSFTCQYVLLHGMEAFYLRRLFAGGTDAA